jgi:hypothetical protein
MGAFVLELPDTRRDFMCQAPFHSVRDAFLYGIPGDLVLYTMECKGVE